MPYVNDKEETGLNIFIQIAMNTSYSLEAVYWLGSLQGKGNDIRKTSINLI